MQMVIPKKWHISSKYINVYKRRGDFLKIIIITLNLQVRQKSYACLISSSHFTQSGCFSNKWSSIPTFLIKATLAKEFWELIHTSGKYWINYIIVFNILAESKAQWLGILGKKICNKRYEYTAMFVVGFTCSGYNHSKSEMVVSKFDNK